MNNNTRANKAFVDKFRKELKALFDDVAEIDKKVLNQAVMAGFRTAVENTPVGEYPSEVHFVTKDGKEVRFNVTPKKPRDLQNGWFTTPIEETPSGIQKGLHNSTKYADYVNNGHRVKNKKGQVVGFIKGKFMLEIAEGTVNKEIPRRFNKELERVKKKHDA